MVKEEVEEEEKADKEEMDALAVGVLLEEVGGEPGGEPSG